MTILDETPKHGGEEGELVLKDRSMILAYLEDLLLTGAEVHFRVQGHPLQAARVAGVEEEPARFRARLEAPLPMAWAEGEELELLFTLDDIRFLAPVRILEREGEHEAFFTLPVRVRHADRRGRMRLHFGPREKATVTVLEGFLGARGATGQLLDLSLEGLRLRVDRALTIHGKAPVAVEEGTFPRGTRFPVLRIDQLPYSPVVVCAGQVAHVSADGGPVCIGIRFEGLGEMEAQIIRQVLGRRLPSFSPGFPQRRREGQVQPGEAPRVTVVHEGEHAQPSRKAQKRLLLVVADDLDRAILASALRQDGYQRLHEARTCAEALDHVKVFPMDALILEEQVGPLPAAEVIARLRRQGHAESAPTVLLASARNVRARTLAKAAQIDHVHPRTADFEGEFKEVLEGLLGL